MSRLKNLKISTLLLLMVLGFVGLYAVSGTAGLFMLKQNRSLMAELSHRGIEQANSLSDASLRLFQSRVALINAKTHMDGGQIEERDAALVQANVLVEQSLHSFNQFARLINEQGDEAEHQAVVQHYESLIHDILLPLAAALQGWNGIEANRIIDQELEPTSQAFVEALEAFQRSNRQMATNATQQADAMTSQAIQALLVLLVIALCMAFLIHRLVRLTMLQPLRTIQQHCELMTTGDLRTRLNQDRNNEIGTLLHGFNTMQDNLVHTIAAVHSETDSMHRGTQDIAQRSQQMDRHIMGQNDALDNVAQAIERLQGTVEESRQHANEALSLAATTNDTVDSGHHAMQQVTHTMDQIADSAKRIAAIVKIINGIATQTNLLAMNVAVEAARAGEHGKGFTVVAGEVRELAQRSSKAANDIRALINESTRNVSTGTEHVQQATVAMNAILKAVQTVNDRIHWIGQTTEDQAKEMATVSTIVREVKNNAWESMELIQQTSRSAEQMTHQATRLRSVASAFQIAS